MALRRMDSKYDGKCSRCGGWFAAGTRIDFNTDTRKAEHADGVCPERPAAPPPIELVQVEPLIKQVEAQLAPMQDAVVALRKAAQDTKSAADTALRAAGWCCSCDGSGYVRNFTTYYDCSCRTAGPRATSRVDVLRENPALEPLERAANAAAAEYARVEGGINQLQRRLEHLMEPDKGYEVVVVKGRKVPKGTRGIVIYLASGNYGVRLGLKDAAGTAHWTSPGNVTATAIPEKRAREIMEGRYDHQQTRYTEVARERSRYRGYGRWGYR